MAIDMHAHWISPTLSDALRQRKTPPMISPLPEGGESLGVLGFTAPLTPGFDDIELRVPEMDATGITRAVLSLTTVYGVESLPLAESLPLCRLFNDSVAAVCAKYPERFSGLAALPGADAGAMLAEFERAMAMPGMVGALLLGDGFLTRKRAEMYRPLFAAADRRRAEGDAAHDTRAVAGVRLWF